MYVCVSGLSLDCVVGHLRPSHVFSSIHEVDLLAIDLHSSFPSSSYSGCHGYHLFVALQSDKDNLLEKGRHIKMSSWKYSCAPDSTRKRKKNWTQNNSPGSPAVYVHTTTNFQDTTQRAWGWTMYSTFLLHIE